MTIFIFLPNMKSPEIIRTVSTSHSEFILRNDSILEIKLTKGVYFTIEESKEINHQIVTISNGVPCKVLVEAGKLNFCDEESRKWSTSKEASDPIIALALLINSLPQKLIANFIVNVQKPRIPTKVFTTKKDAESWLLSFT
ncbi:MAG: hypothetical protein HOH13_04315 [Crocinitomicaceae bacterium]|jgi:hypothetical protein|nr:hypothetical protein [Crocinitomicaceae bacterium]